MAGSGASPSPAAAPTSDLQFRCPGCRGLHTVPPGITEFICPRCRMGQRLPRAHIPRPAKASPAPPPPPTPPPDAPRPQPQPTHPPPPPPSASLRSGPRAQDVDRTKIQLPCPCCKAILNVPHDLAGFRCPHCNVDIPKIQHSLAPATPGFVPPPPPAPPVQMPHMPFLPMAPPSEPPEDINEMFLQLSLGLPHPDPAVETPSLSVVQPREPTYSLTIMDEFTKALCRSQIGATVYACQTGSKPPLPFQYLKDITSNFSNDRILGKGGFGVVYKGLLENGEIIAVKKLLHTLPDSETQFENEVNLLMKLDHQNIVRLLGYCYETRRVHTPHEGDFVFVWNTESLLCLECLPKGSLNSYISDASSGLDWHTCCKIIEGISFGLQYLHEHPNVPIIHLDLKPANILLDGNMVPKITDFGLSRLFDQSRTMHTKNNIGTRGYMPPEYVDRGIITPMSDIFSLGVIIMEVITGHRDYPYDIKKSSEDFIERELLKWRNRLQEEPECTSLETDCQQIQRCLQIGLICVNPERIKRPTMNKVVDMLQGLESMNWYISNELTLPKDHV
ncbi:hypothetical protein VPH35_025696 [Triticum aestivum]|uniref:non-specific serine/threonine protein kinase n=2 Tax=Triticum aestivum TaxID=4565 RepID=A0A3B6BXK6_WHEAT|nr:cysteine-rich receptor-like protein kinase 10 [Triticum aestivum]